MAEARDEPEADELGPDQARAGQAGSRRGIRGQHVRRSGRRARTRLPGPLRFKHKQLKGDLSIMQWAHFVPDYDKWLDNTYIKQWGEKNDVQVKIDHINNALLPSAAASEVSAQKGHDLFQFLFPPSALEKQTLPLNDIVQEVTKKLGKMTDVAYKSTYNPKTKRYFGFADNYVPDPIQYRKSMWFNAGVAPNTWDNVRKAAADPEEGGSSGRARHVERARLEHVPDVAPVLLRSRRCRTRTATRRSTTRARSTALNVMKDIYQNGESDEVFAWTAASNNQAFLAGRLSMAVNAISIARSAEDSGQHRALGRHVAPPIPRGSVRALGNEHVMGIFFIWKFAQNKEAAKQYLVDQQLGLPGPLHPVEVLQLPRLDECGQGRVPGDEQAGGRRQAQAARQVHDPDDDRARSTRRTSATRASRMRRSGTSSTSS